MSILKKSLILLAVVVLIIIAGTILRIRARIVDPAVTVTVRNATNAMIAVQIKHERGNLAIGALRSGEQKTVRYNPKQSESAYKLMVTLSNGKKMSTGEYVEPGYRMTHTITNTKIKVEYHLP